MKKAKLRKIIQKPLRFHHQDIHDEVEGLTDLLMQIGNRLIVIENMLKEIKDNEKGGFPYLRGTVYPLSPEAKMSYD